MQFVPSLCAFKASWWQNLFPISWIGMQLVARTDDSCQSLLRFFCGSNFVLMDLRNVPSSWKPYTFMSWPELAIIHQMNRWLYLRFPTFRLKWDHKRIKVFNNFPKPKWTHLLLESSRFLITLWPAPSSHFRKISRSVNSENTEWPPLSRSYVMIICLLQTNPF